MFKHIFLNSVLDLQQLAIELFRAIGVNNNFNEGDSMNVLDGVYFSYSVFGVKIKLESNSYQYDDKYKYMLTVRKDFLFTFQADEQIVEDVVRIIIKMLLNNLNTEIALEESEGSLKVFNPRSS